MTDPDFAYTALIRTNRVDHNLGEVVTALRAQTMPPAEILLVDSSGQEDVTRALSAFGRVVPYGDRDFNYSRAVNVGMAEVKTPYALVISSHTVPARRDLIETGWSAARDAAASVLYWSPLPDALPGRDNAIVNRITVRSFTGKNGFSNSMGMLPTDQAIAHPFREEVPASEDQEWAKRYFERNRDAVIIGVTDPDLFYRNPVIADEKKRADKYVLEEVSYLRHIAAPRKIPVEVAARLARSALALVRGRRVRAAAHARIVIGYFRR